MDKLLKKILPVLLFSYFTFTAFPALFADTIDAAVMPDSDSHSSFAERDPDYQGIGYIANGETLGVYERGGFSDPRETFDPKAEKPVNLSLGGSDPGDEKKSEEETDEEEEE